MKNLLLIFCVIVAFGTAAQDKIIHHSGKTETVRILTLKKESNLIVYVSSNDTIYSSINNFDTVIVHSQLNTTHDNNIEVGSTSSANFREDNFRKSKAYGHQYAQYSVSTNLTALIIGRATLEVEYRFNNKLSIKFPLTFGIYNSRRSYYIDPYFSDRYTNYSTAPKLHDEPNVHQTEDIVVQLGINPKYYFLGKSGKYVTPYVGAAVNFGIMKDYGMDFYVESDTTGYMNSVYSNGSYVYEWNTYWNSSPQSQVEKVGERNYYNFEALFGVDFNFSQRITATVESGFSSKFYGEGTTNSRVYQKIGNGNYDLIHSTEPSRKIQRHSYVKFRILLTYHI